MNKPIPRTWRPRPSRCAPLALALLLGACGDSSTPTRPGKEKDAAAYNVQLGIAYLNQGEISLAKDKLDRAVKEDPSSADVHSARAMLFARMALPDQADGEFRSA